MNFRNTPVSFAAILMGGLISTLTAQTLVDFGDVALTTPPATLYAGGGVYYNGSDGAGGFSSQGVRFLTDYNATYSSWTGWAYSTVGDTSTPGWGNQYASFAGSGYSDSTFAVGYAGFGLSLELPVAADLDSVFLSNGSYAGISMTLGDDFAKKFGGAEGSDPDFFLLTMTGRDASGTETGTVGFYLADFRATDPSGDYIVDTWTEVDLTGLGIGVKTIEFTMSSSDNGDFGMNTPSYFVLDNLSFTAAIPEPGTLPLVLSAFVALLGLRRRQR